MALYTTEVPSSRDPYAKESLESNTENLRRQVGSGEGRGGLETNTENLRRQVGCGEGRGGLETRG